MKFAASILRLSLTEASENTHGTGQVMDLKITRFTCTYVTQATSATLVEREERQGGSPIISKLLRESGLSALASQNKGMASGSLGSA